MEKSNSQKIKVGIFVVVGTVLLIAALYFIGSRQQMFSKNIDLYGVFENANGLQLGNNVRYSGVNVGTVSMIEMVEEGKIIVAMSVEEKTAFFIKKDAVASIGSDGLVGSMVVNILPGKDIKAGWVVSGDTIKIHSKVSTDEMLSTLNKTNENAALLTADLLKITNQIVAGKGTLGALVSDSLIAKDIRQSAAELKRMTSGATHAISQINTIISKINYDESAAALLLSDTVSKNQIQKVFGNLEKSSANIKEVTKTLDDYINEIQSGKGTLNYVTQDEVLVQTIDSTMINIKEAAEKLNENMEALKHNFLFRGYFRKLERKERKEAKEN
ncbi:phospholipid/cholesterol/gamma-HCH transport system substrate-binding protein [Gelidibacter algens]|uniref:Phospholipid/cholesterol/gamma-HCH transport system substrate-binding protein n=1 Tax=Gelidibacter algens TaxID=49280 RepID=A0A1A7R529_9FLAO|nr:MlaD family protein [Gelidibacter algens]OBX25867.1 ABC transporter permease [Gelidibacter algens]RAJ20620.1 phospholipid/cholesterol/gamma-HCH transport system substrate-binding protein [Gelidibacter algens]